MIRRRPKRKKEIKKVEEDEDEFQLRKEAWELFGEEISLLLSEAFSMSEAKGFKPNVIFCTEEFLTAHISKLVGFSEEYGEHLLDNEFYRSDPAFVEDSDVRGKIYGAIVVVTDGGVVDDSTCKVYSHKHRKFHRLIYILRVTKKEESSEEGDTEGIRESRD